ncbi:uncharacterized protein LOC116297475 [Actinia tenebrosa]|uniref:Uncharacterized protein LOC116297475 n=1 Tax=Actinia tenebrosa TaxID=6105 RepID=A0A6P8I1Y9_ACTTE|nr:uncharacterized protein LOC116297475 [Actinia tenebrosa]
MVTAVVVTPFGRLKRKFKKGVYFQEVYDWIATHEQCSIFFSLSTFDNNIILLDKIQNESQGLLYYKELSKEEAEKIFRSEVSFFGSYEYVDDLDNTVNNDVPQHEEVGVVGKCNIFMNVPGF